MTMPDIFGIERWDIGYTLGVCFMLQLWIIILSMQRHRFIQYLQYEWYSKDRRTQELNGYQCNWYRRNIMKRQIIISQNNCRPKRVRHVFCLSCNKMFIIHIYVNNKNAKQKCYIFNLIMIISILSIQNSNIYIVKC